MTERAYYDIDYDPDHLIAPTCYALAANAGDLVPHENVKEGVNDTCKGCPMAEFGSAERGNGPACKTYRRLAVMSVTALEQDEIAEAEIATCKISPTSVKAWSKYAVHAEGKGQPLWAQTTVIKNQPDDKNMQRQTMTQGIYAAPEQMGPLMLRIEEAEQLVSEPYTYEELEEPAPAKKKKVTSDKC
jgi:hypothetical protein